ncbi:hypothetical protein [Plebeiibacterium marinum]|uniref:DUF3157 family protein n=1 Tax=Plebeiibacterium marinum TaxID=2992111 RepID=A0AAE3MI46_9BACT|nr:hypothetical protein [Plebeiobacterium marinum]MCW3807512.1 hypothetical protein [Plebeiobacterium marinum]
MNRIILLFFMTFISSSIFAQIEATTSEGKKVVLYENGTWEYVTEAVTTTEIETITSSDLSARGEMQEIYFAVSKRLERFFGSPKNKIRGKSQCQIVNGQAKITFQWETYLGDGNRYFGYLKEGKTLKITLRGGKEIPLTLTENVTTDIRDKYNVTIFSGTALINEDQLSSLLKLPAESVIVDWKKNSEEYKIEDQGFFRTNFTELLKNQ